MIGMPTTLSTLRRVRVTRRRFIRISAATAGMALLPSLDRLRAAPTAEDAERVRRQLTWPVVLPHRTMLPRRLIGDVTGTSLAHCVAKGGQPRQPPILLFDRGHASGF